MFVVPTIIVYSRNCSLTCCVPLTVCSSISIPWVENDLFSLLITEVVRRSVNGSISYQPEYESVVKI